MIEVQDYGYIHKHRYVCMYVGMINSSKWESRELVWGQSLFPADVQSLLDRIGAAHAGSRGDSVALRLDADAAQSIPRFRLYPLVEVGRREAGGSPAMQGHRELVFID